jgi:hypothetical protein
MNKGKMKAAYRSIFLLAPKVIQCKSNSANQSRFALQQNELINNKERVLLMNYLWRHNKHQTNQFKSE